MDRLWLFMTKVLFFLFLLGLFVGIPFLDQRFLAYNSGSLSYKGEYPLPPPSFSPV